MDGPFEDDTAFFFFFSFLSLHFSILFMFPFFSQSLTLEVSSVVGAPWRCGVVTT